MQSPLLLEHCARTVLDEQVARRFAVLDPIRVVLTNFPEGKVEKFSGPLYPQKKDPNGCVPACVRTHVCFYVRTLVCSPAALTRPSLSPQRELPLTRVVYIERDDFRLEDDKDFYGLAPGKEVYLKYAYAIKCDSYTLGDDGKTVVELRCTVDLTSRQQQKVCACKCVGD